MSDQTEKLVAMFAPVISALGCVLWGVEFNRQGKYSVLRVYIDKDSGVDVEDCAEVSRQLSGILDVEDPISGEYTLEVSSPGIERPLFTVAQYEQYIGAEVALQLRVRFDNKRKFTGVITAVENDEVVLVSGEEQYTLPVELIEKAHLVARF